MDNMKNKLKDAPQYRATDIQKDIWYNEGIMISYFMAWHRREKAISKLIDSYEDNYNNLEGYCHHLKIKKSYELYKIGSWWKKLLSLIVCCL